MTHDPIAQTISVEPILPAEKVIIATPAFLTTLSKVELEIAGLAIKDAQGAQHAANLLQRLTTAGTALETARKSVKAPFLQKCAEIDEAARAPAKRIEDAKTSLKRMQVAYAEEQARIAAEAERKRQAELRALEEMRREEERLERERREAIAREVAELTAKLAVPVMDVDFGDEPAPEPVKTETERRIEELKHAPAAQQAAPAGVSFKSKLIIASVDVAKLPDMFVVRTANERAIRETFCVGWKEGEPIPECAGVAFRVDKIVASTGKAGF